MIMPSASSSLNIDIKNTFVSIERQLKRSRDDAEQLAARLAQLTALTADLDALGEIQQKIRADLTILDETKKQVQLEQDLWQMAKAKAHRIAKSRAQRKVKLNIGGQIFVTTLETLMAEKNTFFCALFSECFDTRPDENGEIFIDRYPRHFCIILNHLRGIDVSKCIEMLNQEDRNLLEQDIDFYQVESLSVLLRKNEQRNWDVDPNRVGPVLAITKNDDDDSTKITRVRGGYGDINNAAIGEMGFSTGVHRWTVRVENVNEFGNWIGLGVCKLQDMLPHTNNETSSRSSEKLFYGKSCRGDVFKAGKMQPAVGREWSAGTVVEIKLDCDKGKLLVDDIIVDIPRK